MTLVKVSLGMWLPTAPCGTPPSLRLGLPHEVIIVFRPSYFDCFVVAGADDLYGSEMGYSSMMGHPTPLKGGVLRRKGGWGETFCFALLLHSGITLKGANPAMVGPGQPTGSGC